MATKKKLLQAAAGTAAASGGAGALNVEDVFSTYLYEGNGSSQIIENGINLGQSNSGGGAYFTGANNNRVNVPASSDFGFGTGDYTIEFFVFKTSDKNYITYYDQRTASQNATTASPFIYSDSGGTLYFYVESTNRISGSGTNVATGAWTHVAVCRSSGSTRMFVNGTQIGSGFADSINYVTPASTWSFGGSIEQNTYNVEGYMSNVRVVKGSALYTSNFTAPTSALTAVSGTVLLALQGDDPFTDNSSSAHSLTASGSAKASTFGPFDAADAGEGGLVWIKDRADGTNWHQLFDTERGDNQALATNATNPSYNILGLGYTGRFFNFNSTGFSVNDTYHANINGNKTASWTFRKAPKFFDVVTYTGDGTAGRTVSHNLGSVPAFIVIKRTDSTGDWTCYHRSLGNAKDIQLNYSSPAYNSSAWNSTTPTDSVFTLGSSTSINGSGATYVAYLFAHNNGDGEFGSTADQDVIKCGSYTGDGSGSSSTVIDLGFEPQWIMIKSTTTNDNWYMFDSMRGITSGGNNSSPTDADLRANSTNAEYEFNRIALEPNGFRLEYNDGTQVNGLNQNYIYIAIRRGPMAVPTAATDVFAIDQGINSSVGDRVFNAGFPVDLMIRTDPTTTYNRLTLDRLRGNGAYVITNGTDAETDTAYAGEFDDMEGVFTDTSFDFSNHYAYMWQRRPSFCDVVAYTGTGSAKTVSHNLGVAPEMIWVKDRDRSVYWSVFHKDLGSSKRIKLNETAAADNSTGEWNAVDPTSTEFTVGVNTSVNFSGDDYIAYLFASVDGVSKVGSFTSDGTDLTIDCGFTSGARFILLRDTSALGAWFVWDTERGIVAGNDPSLKLNDTAAENTSNDFVDPHSSGFIVNSSFTGTGKLWIYYAIA